MPPRPDRSDGVRPGGVSRLRAIDPLVPVVAGASLVVYVLHGFHGMLTRDLGIYSYAGQQVADGVPPYLGVLNRAGPLAHVLPGVGALVARLGGLDDVLTMRVLFMLMATAAVCLTTLGLDAEATFARLRAATAPSINVDISCHVLSQEMSLRKWSTLAIRSPSSFALAKIFSAA